MINYSIGARLSQPGDNTSTKKYYCNVQYSTAMTFDEFCEHISTHGSVYSRADVAAIVTQAVDCLRELLLEGYRIKLGDMGDYQATLKSVGTESASDFSASNITYVGVRWTKGDRFENMIDDATFNLVATRDAAAAILAAVKAGETTADWSSDSSDDTSVSDGDSV